jgi:RND family efflux transporter MFP subunit
MQSYKKPEKTKKSDKKWLRRIWGALPSLFLLFLITLIVVLFVRIKSEQELMAAEKQAQLKKEEPAVNVVALELVPLSLKDRINFPGTIEPWVKLNVVSEVRATVFKKLVEEGDTVTKGQIIVRLDSREYENQYNSAKASYQMALASLKRFEKLFTRKSTTQSQLDNAVSQVKNYKSAMDNAALNLARCRIKSPLDGVVNRIFIENGQYLRAADKVAEILQIDPVKVIVGIPESDVDATRKLTDFNLTIDALGGKTFHAKKHYLSKTTDNAARLYNLKLRLENPDREILPDMFARVEIVKQEIPDGISVPLFTVITRNDEKIVYVVNDGKAQMRKVELGFLDGWRSQVKNGLSIGDRVIVIGHRNVNDGQKIKVVRQVKDPKELTQ